jgi:hypothetical protein
MALTLGHHVFAGIGSDGRRLEKGQTKTTNGVRPPAGYAPVRSRMPGWGFTGHLQKLFPGGCMQLFKVLSVVLFVPILAQADTLSLTGSLDANNPNDVFLTTITLAVTSNLTIQTWSYGGTANATGGTNAAGMVIPSGGFDTYLSLFEGSGPSATFLASNDDGGCGPAAPGPTFCEDSRLDLTSLAAGDYTLALTLPFNYSFAENLGSGTLGDGFIGLQGDYYDSGSDEVRTSAYAVDITRAPSESSTPPALTPEPSSLVLLATGLAASLAPMRRRWRGRTVP